jgi:hypothetical protein
MPQLSIGNTEQFSNNNISKRAVADHFALRLLKNTPAPSRSRNSHIFNDDTEFWYDALNRVLRPGDDITLQHFAILEWFPRVPGLYHTPKSYRNRPQALQFVDELLSSKLEQTANDHPIDFSRQRALVKSLNNPSSFTSEFFRNPNRFANVYSANNTNRFANFYSPYNRFANLYIPNSPIAQGALDERFRNYQRPIIFNPHGKLTMLESGIGSVRLAPLERDSELFWLCSASSIGWSDHGVPLVVPDALYQDVFPEIRETGCVRAKIRGRVHYIYNNTGSKDSLTRYIRHKIYDTYHGLPRLYLYVDDIDRDDRLKDEGGDLKVCAAVTFISAYEAEKPRHYATYVGFNPSITNNMEDAVDWMTESYVEGRYQGRIVTDFDEQFPRFSDAIFSLRYINQQPQFDGEDLQRRFGAMGIDAVPREIRWVINNFGVLNGGINDMSTGDQYTAGQAGAMGPGAHAHDMTFQQITETANKIDLKQLAADLSLLRAAMKKEEGTTAEQDLAIGSVAAAEAAAAKGDGPGALQHLKAAGKWAFDVATNIGASVAAAALKGPLGIP